jgi:hypothetical protein
MTLMLFAGAYGERCFMKKVGNRGGRRERKRGGGDDGKREREWREERGRGSGVQYTRSTLYNVYIYIILQQYTFSKQEHGTYICVPAGTESP